MERTPRSLAEASQLIQLGKLLNQTIDTVIDEWSRETYTSKDAHSKHEINSHAANGINGTEANGAGGVQAAAEANEQTSDNPHILPSRRLHQAQRTILAISGSLTELMTEPCHRLQELATQFYEARALGIAAERRIPEILASAGENGMDVETIADKTGIQHKKLYRLPKYLLGPKGQSYDVCETSFQEALGTSKPRWDWLAERVSPEEITNGGPGYPGVPDPKNWSHLSPDADGKIPRPELDTFSLAMVGGGKVSAASHPFDYPWGDLPQGATVVDVGGGVGGFIVQLLSAYPHLKCICQDRAEVIQQAHKTFWPQSAPKLLRSGKVELQVHDFFEPNPVQGADIYWLRGILHDWSDIYCINILSALRPSLSPKSRVLICDQVMNTTLGFPSLPPAPSPLPANYGYYTRYCHLRDISLMTSINGIERTPEEFKRIIEKAGLRLEKIWETRSLQWIVEARL